MRGRGRNSMVREESNFFPEGLYCPVWQCRYFTAGFHVAGRLGRAIVAEDGAARLPVMLPPRDLGSFERFHRDSEFEH